MLKFTLIVTLLLIGITTTLARDYCIKSSYVSVWCDDGYKCCDNDLGYWLFFNNILFGKVL